MTVPVRTLAAFLEERTPGCEASVVRDARGYGVTASIYISELEIHRNAFTALGRMPYVDWAALSEFTKTRSRAVGPYASRAILRRKAGL